MNGRRRVSVSVGLAVWLAFGAMPAAGQTSPTATATPTSTSTTPAVTGTPTATRTPTFARTPTAAPVEVAGTYTGTWASAAGAGTATLTVAGDSDALSGTMVFEGHPCLTLARFTGRASGTSVNGSITSLTSVVVGNTRLTANPAGLTGTYSLLAGCTVAANGTLALQNSPGGTVRGTATATSTTGAASPTRTPTPTATATATPGVSGDCDGNGLVAVDEIVSMVSIGLSTRPLDRCPAADRNGDGRVTVDEILRGISAALYGVGGSETPPPLVGRCPVLGGTRPCVCRDETCCVVGQCDTDEPCTESSDCRLGFRCEAVEGATVCRPWGTAVVPPPR